MKENFPIYERNLITQLGVKRQAVIDVRNKQLVRETDWSKDGLKICYTKDAADRLMAIFVPATVTQVPVVVPPDVSHAVVKRANYLNRQIITVTLINLDNDQPIEDVNVRVKDAYKYLPGMKITAKRQAGSPTWIIHGREPRYRGKW